MTKQAQAVLSKPEMPDITLQGSELPFKLALDMDRYQNGNLCMGYETAEVSTSGKKVGDVTLAMGGGVAVCIGKITYHVSVLEIFKAAQKADAQYKGMIERGEV